MAGTPRFDRDHVLRVSAQAFADRGYEGASISHLVSATGLLRGSLYGAFGSKAELFRYAYLHATGHTPHDDDLVLDLTVVALRERAAHDPTVAARTREVLTSLHQRTGSASDVIFSRLLRRAGVAPDPSPRRPDPQGGNIG
ncbi:helix-turn-helix domain-containing protein [Luedemannella helvata]|uniref:HTH tetR-type domain-containing protein n=1 Tax=Luedemannella helvata TaxID=349315 RepID=A0ABN2K040_9ACTN